MAVTSSHIVCAAPNCPKLVTGKRVDALYCSDTCRWRAHYHRNEARGRDSARERKRDQRQRDREAHPHPYRDTPQYQLARQAWPEHDGYRCRDLDPSVLAEVSAGRMSVRSISAPIVAEMPPAPADPLVETREYMIPGATGDDETLTYDPFALGWS